MKKSVKAQMAKDALRAAMERKVVDLGTVKTAKAATLEADAFDVGEPPQEPVPVRYRTCDSTYEALTELLIGNPTGILFERDELVSLLKYLDREEHAVARGFTCPAGPVSSPTPSIVLVAGSATLRASASRSLATHSRRRLANM